jgi:two-component system, OmpR family, KDP operon response regulator KdpE
MGSAHDGRGSKIPASSLKAVGIATQSRQKAILIVEDDPALLAFYKSTLLIEGFAIVTASDGLDALHRIEHRPPDLIVLDLGLPRLSGHDLRREISAHAHTRHIPVIVVTGQDGVDACDFDCVLRKPVDAATLVSAVEECLREQRH